MMTKTEWMTKVKQNEEGMSIIQYVEEEVRRQGHDVTMPDGLNRVAWMLKAWSWAMQHYPLDVP